MILKCPFSKHPLPCYHLVLFIFSDVDWPNIDEMAILVAIKILPVN